MIDCDFASLFGVGVKGTAAVRRAERWTGSEPAEGAHNAERGSLDRTTATMFGPE